MNQKVEEVRLALGGTRNARGFRKFYERGEGRRDELRAREDFRGATAYEVAEELGINGWTMQRWLQNHRAEGQPREAFHHVEVLASTKAALVLRGAWGECRGALGGTAREASSGVVVLGLSRRLRVFAYGVPTDMRKSFNTLSALVLSVNARRVPVAGRRDRRWSMST
ncbi:MAG: hypothetical protein IPJ65_04080 [Archangiaceae bacterium]|nr:hypothetical protein [Archangiaceae bacterium]